MRRLSLILSILIGLSGVLFSQPSMAILDFEPKNGITPEIADYLTEKASIEIFKTKQFRVLEREAIKRIIQEQNLELSGMTAQSSATRVGELISADKLLLGSVGLINRRFVLSVRMVNVETGEIEFGESYEADSEEELSRLGKRIAADLTRTDRPAAVPEESEDFSLDFLDSSLNYFIGHISQISNTINQASSFTSSAPSAFSRQLESLIRDEINKALSGQNLFRSSSSSPSVVEPSTTDPEADAAEIETEEEASYDDSAALARHAREELARRQALSNAEAEESASSGPEVSDAEDPDNEDNGDHKKAGGRGGLAFRFSLLDSGDTIYYSGIRGFWIANDWFRLGGGGYAGFQASQPEKPWISYGGLVLDLYNRSGPLGIDLSLLAGGGAFPQNTLNPQPFFAIEPSLEATIRVFSWIDLHLTMSYLYTIPISSGTSTHDFTVGMSLMFGAGG